MTIVFLEDLNRGTSTSYQNSEQAEQIVADLVAGILRLKNIDITKGFNADYDFSAENKFTGKKYTFEVKFTRTIIVPVEYCRGDGVTPSGIQTNKSDYTIFISQHNAKNKETNKYEEVGKLRMFKTEELRDYIMKNYPNAADGFEHGQITKYTKRKRNPGSHNLRIDFKKVQESGELDHLWLGDVEMIEKPKFGYDMGSFKHHFSRMFSDKMAELEWKFYSPRDK